MNIALVILHADPARGGAERYTLDLAEALAERGHQVRIIAETFTHRIEGVENVTIAARGSTRAKRYRAFLDGVEAQLAARPADVVHSMLPIRRCDVYHPHAGVAADAARGITALFNPRRVAMARVEKALLTGANAPVTICLSDYVRRSLLQHYKLPEDRLVTLHNGIDTARFDSAADPGVGRDIRAQIFGPRAPDTIVGLFIANDFKRKGLKQTIKAWRQTCYEIVDEQQGRPHCFFSIVVVGKEDFRRYRDMPDSTTFWGHEIHFAGHTRDPYPFYSAADVLILPTRHDPCSLVVLESLSMGVPVITTRSNGASELMRDGEHGFVIESPDDIDAISAAMKKMLDRHLRQPMREACLALRPALAYEHHIERLLEVYAQASGKPVA